MSHQVGFALSSQWALQRITLHSDAQSGPALVHSEGQWAGRQQPPGFTLAAGGLCSLVHLCVVSEHRDFKSLFRGKDDWSESPSWPLFSAFDVDVQNSCSVFKWTVWCWWMKVDLCSYTKDILLCGGLSAVGGSSSKGQLSLFLWTVKNNFTWACWCVYVYIPFFSVPF